MKRHPLHHRQSSGLTLVEILISMTILAFISLSLYSITSKSFDLRDELENEGDFYNAIRTGFEQIERDIQMTYSPPQAKAAAPAGPEGMPPSPTPPPSSDTSDPPVQPTQFWGIMLPNKTRVSRFQGSADRLAFITSSNIRTHADSIECDLIKVVYTLTADDPEEGIKGASVLQKTIYKSVFNPEEDEKSAITFPVLFGIKSFKFAYYDRARDLWLNEWDSSSMEVPNPFPYAVRVEATIVGTTPDLGPFQIRRYFKPLLPLNEARNVQNEVGDPVHFMD